MSCVSSISLHSYAVDIHVIADFIIATKRNYIAKQDFTASGKIKGARNFCFCWLYYIINTARMILMPF